MSSTQSERAVCPYCNGTGDGELHPGCTVYEPCWTCGGEGTLDADDARRLNENRSDGAR